MLYSLKLLENIKKYTYISYYNCPTINETTITKIFKKKKIFVSSEIFSNIILLHLNSIKDVLVERRTVPAKKIKFKYV